MTQHEYVFVAVSIILGLAITRILHSVATLIRIHSRVNFHWSTALWATSVMAYVLQLWWIGWGLREVTEWSFPDFLVLIIGSILIYGAAEMALPVPDDDDDDDELDFLRHSQGFGRLSVLSMLLYFCIGPYVNLTMLPVQPPLLLVLTIPALGVALTGTMIALPRAFQYLSPLFAAYSLLILYLTA